MRRVGRLRMRVVITHYNTRTWPDGSDTTSTSGISGRYSLSWHGGIVQIQHELTALCCRRPTGVAMVGGSGTVLLERSRTKACGGSPRTCFRRTHISLGPGDPARNARRHEISFRT
jgi:hypothetical protein